MKIQGRNYSISPEMQAEILEKELLNMGSEWKWSAINVDYFCQRVCVYVSL